MMAANSVLGRHSSSVCCCVWMSVISVCGVVCRRFLIWWRRWAGASLLQES